MRGKVVKYSSVTPSVDLAARGYAGGPPTLRVFLLYILISQIQSLLYLRNTLVIL